MGRLQYAVCAVARAYHAVGHNIMSCAGFLSASMSNAQGIYEKGCMVRDMWTVGKKQTRFYIDSDDEVDKVDLMLTASCSTKLSRTAFLRIAKCFGYSNSELFLEG